MFANSPAFAVAHVSVRAGRRGTPVRSRRRGAVAVEFAIVAPLWFLLIFASMEFSRVFLVIHSLEGAARAGCEVAILDGGTEQRVRDRVASVLATSNIDEFTVNLTPSPLSQADEFELVTTTVTVRYDEASWLPIPWYVANRVLTGSCSLPREASEE